MRRIGFMLGLLACAMSASSTTALGQSVSTNAPVCQITATTRPLMEDVRETSGLARGRAQPDVLWTHNDSGNHPEIFGLAYDGTLRSRVSVTGVLFTDWEDMEAGPCATGNCIYIADIGDNEGLRSHVSIYEIPEPVPDATEVAASRAINARYTDGPQDAEALFMLPSGELYVVTKGRQKSIKLYRLSAAGAGDHATLQLVRELAPQPAAEADRVTAATASPNGEWVAIRSYANLFLYRTADLLRDGGTAALTYSLLPLGEKQGESLALSDDGTIYLTSEAERKKDLPTIANLKCTL